jgi:hypothetical protein
VCAWRLTVPEGHRFEATQALRQVLNRAVAWKLIDENPAKRGVPNPARRCREQRPFESWAQIRSVAELLGPMFGPMVVFAAATGLRPSEMFALEHGDVDCAAGVVQLAIDSYQHAVSLLDALALERAVDAGWTPAQKPAKPHSDRVSRPRERASRRAVDARWTSKPRPLATSASRRG